MKTPKKFNKMSLEQQEAYLIQQLKEANKNVDAIMKMLGTVRGGKKVQIMVDERPDENKEIPEQQ